MKSMSKKLRIAIIWVLIIIVGINSALLINTLVNPVYKEEKTTLYSYNSKADVGYKVILKPNILYNIESMGEEKTYITKYVDHIEPVFNYKFAGNKLIDIKGSYDIIAIVEGYIIQEEKEKTIWQKEYVLLPKADFNIKSRDISITKEVNINLGDYNDFVYQLSEEAKLNTNVKLKVLMNVSLGAIVDNEEIKKTYSPIITIPLDTSYFEVTKSGVEEQPGVIEKTKQLQLPINKKVIIMYSIFIGIAFLGLLYIVIFTRGNKQVNLLLKNIKKIFKVHESRLVAINDDIEKSYETYYKVKSINDLVKIADEIEKPIIYIYSENIIDIYKFFVYDDKSLFCFDALEALDINGAKSTAVINKKNNTVDA